MLGGSFNITEVMVEGDESTESVTCLVDSTFRVAMKKAVPPPTTTITKRTAVRMVLPGVDFVGGVWIVVRRFIGLLHHFR